VKDPSSNASTEQELRQSAPPLPLQTGSRELKRMMTEHREPLLLTPLHDKKTKSMLPSPSASTGVMAEAAGGRVTGDDDEDQTPA
jgi:hypothetical protein